MAGARRSKAEHGEEKDEVLDQSSDPLLGGGLADEHLIVLIKLQHEQRLSELEAQSRRQVALLRAIGGLAVVVMVMVVGVAYGSLALGVTQDVETLLVSCTPLVVGLVAAVGIYWNHRL